MAEPEERQEGGERELGRLRALGNEEQLQWKMGLWHLGYHGDFQKMFPSLPNSLFQQNIKDEGTILSSQLQNRNDDNSRNFHIGKKNNIEVELATKFYNEDVQLCLISHTHLLHSLQVEI